MRPHEGMILVCVSFRARAVFVVDERFPDLDILATPTIEFLVVTGFTWFLSLRQVMSLATGFVEESWKDWPSG